MPLDLPMTRRVGVVGTFVWDTIHPCGDPNPPFEQWGGLSYSLNAFAGACPPGWEVVPIAKVGQDLISSTRELVAGLPAVADDSGLMAVPEPNNRVELRYRTNESREETLTGGVSPWDWDQLEPRLQGLDALYINYLSGMEMPLPVAEAIRGHFAGPIYADFHSLFLGPPDEGPRAPRCLPDAERWLRTADVVQMNRDEYALLMEGLAGVEWPGDLLGEGLSAMLITAGAAGAEAWAMSRHPLERRAGGTAEHIRAPLEDSVTGGDPTGCGDIWGAVTCCEMLRGASLENAMGCGNRAAAARVRHGGIDGLHAVVRAAVQAAEAPGRVP